MNEILEKLKTRFDDRIVQPDELSRKAHDEIVRLLKEIENLRAERTEAAKALENALAGKPVRNADEIISKRDIEPVTDMISDIAFSR